MRHFHEIQPGILLIQTASPFRASARYRAIQPGIFARDSQVALEPISPLGLSESLDEIVQNGEFFQFASPVTQTICGTTYHGETSRGVVTGTPALSKSLDDQLQVMWRLAANNVGKMPFGQFGHNLDDTNIAFRPLKFLWGGSDPVKGGVLCAVRWTQAGLKAVCAGEFQFVSPQFFGPDQEFTRIDGITECVGGLVNKTAFTQNQPLPRQALIRATRAKAFQFCQLIREEEAAGSDFSVAVQKLKTSQPYLAEAWEVCLHEPGAFGL